MRGGAPAAAALLLLAGAASASQWPERLRDGGAAPESGGVPASFDCAQRKLAYQYGKQLTPRMGAFAALHEALDLSNPKCNTSLSGGPAPAPAKPRQAVPPDAVVVAPGESVQKAVDAAAAANGAKTVLLRGGAHYLPDTLRLGAEHSGLTVASYPGERAVVSGGKELTLAWRPHNTTAPANVYVADVPKGAVAGVPGLQLGGARATRARYPNLPHGIEASCGYGCMVGGKNAEWVPPDMDKYGKVSFYTDAVPAHDRNDTANNWFKHYMIGINGLCSVYDPPVSYWCSEHPSGGGAFAFRTPSGVTPKAGALPRLAGWKHPEDALWFVWRPSRWANWMFETGKVDGGTFTFGKGGNQGARGNNNGGDFFVENVFEELDNPGEFFFDTRESKLYLWHNGTGAPPSTVVVPQKKVLVNMTGTQWRPVTGVSIKDTTFSATAYTYMEPHGVPSAGDWALERFAAVFLEGTEGAVVDGCAFERLDGNGVMVSGYNRNATVRGSDFSYIGGNAVAAWGYTNETSGDNHPQAGVDGTDGNHPRYTTVTSNTAREIGLYEKQSSFYVQAKTAQSVITGNVFFNGPRAGINANDGFGGGDEIAHNLVFSTCRESGDHGPFNSWDRQPFLTTVRDGTPSMTPAWREIHHNFFVDNYSPQENVDNDDGSSYYHTHDNLFVYGGNGMKNDFGGHDNYHTNNIYAYVGQAIGFYDAPMLDGHEDHFSSNTVVMTGTNLGSQTCSGAGKTVMGDNKYYTQSGKVTECKVDLADWQKQGNDKGSTVAAWPSDDTLIGWAKQKLGIKG